MNCPKCGNKTRVTDSRPSRDSVYRVRTCTNEECRNQFTTSEQFYKEGRATPKELLPKSKYNAIENRIRRLNKKRRDAEAESAEMALRRQNIKDALLKRKSR